MQRKTNLFPAVDPDTAKPMRYRIEVNVFGEGQASDEPTVLFANNETSAEQAFWYFLNNGRRPVRLFKDGELVKSAENGLRIGC